MNILLTGATGYLGAQLVKYLLQFDYNIICVVHNIQKLGQLSTVSDRVCLIPVDSMVHEIKKLQIDTVIHTACKYVSEGNSFEEIVNANLLFPLHILEQVIELGDIRWINIGTCLPPEVNSYSLAKDQFRQWGKWYASNRKIQFIHLIMEHFYGTDAPENNFLQWAISLLQANESLALTEGTQKRDFIHVSDVLRIIKAVITADLTTKYLEIPVGTGDAPTIREVVEYLKKITMSQSELLFGEVPMRANEPNSCCDISILQMLGAVPRINWKTGMKDVVTSSLKVL